MHSLRSGILGAEENVPFELSVLEALLSETVQQFERHLKRLLLLSESVEREVTYVLKASSGDLTRLLPIQKLALILLICQPFSTCSSLCP